MGNAENQDLVDQLNRSDLVCGDIELARLIAAKAQMKSYVDQEVIYREGEPGNVLNILLEGRVRLDKNREPIFHVGAGSVFGEFPIIDPDLRLTVTAVADASNVLIASVPRASFLELADHNPMIWRRLCRTLVERLMQKD